MRLPWSARRLEHTRRAMSTFVSITVEDRSAARGEEAIGRAFEELERLESLLSRFDRGSALGVLNAEGRIADPPGELVDMLRFGLDLHRSTAGAFDPTVAPLVDAYQLHFAAHGGPPEEHELRDVLELVGAEHVRVQAGVVDLQRGGMALTLDGIAKGYIVDRLVAMLAAQGVRHALVNAGGDLRALGARASGRPWRVGVQDPRQPDRLAGVVDLADAALATSGDYVRFLDVDRNYHHTVVPATGRSPQAIASVSVRAGSAMEADALATAVFVAGADAGLQLLERLPGAAGLVMLRDGSRRSSRHW